MFPTNVCFGKYNLKDRSPCVFKRYDAELTLFKLVLALITRVISSVHCTI